MTRKSNQLIRKFSLTSSPTPQDAQMPSAYRLAKRESSGVFRGLCSIDSNNNGPLDRLLSAALQILYLLSFGLRSYDSKPAKCLDWMVRKFRPITSLSFVVCNYRTTWWIILTSPHEKYRMGNLTPQFNAQIKKYARIDL